MHHQKEDPISVSMTEVNLWGIMSTSVEDVVTEFMNTFPKDVTLEDSSDVEMKNSEVQILSSYKFRVLTFSEQFRILHLRTRRRHELLPTCGCVELHLMLSALSPITQEVHVNLLQRFRYIKEYGKLVNCMCI